MSMYEEKVLIVDDSTTIHDHWRDLFAPHNYEVIAADNGHIGFDIANKRHDIGLIITDYNMPEWNGLEFLEKLRTLPRYDSTLIILCSAETRPDLIAQIKKQKITGFLPKPFDEKQTMPILLDKLKKLRESK
ncbi:MAG: response regulator [Sphingobacteriales bacterium]|nr:MAG: response regulator [Sphingobacteriales bacterium]